MLYPTINQYIDSLSDAAQLSKSLAGVEFCTTITGDQIYGSGNFGVVFKMRKGDKVFALKCFTRHQTDRRQAYEQLSDELPTSPYLIGLDWMPSELLVATYGSDLLQPFDLVMMDYVEGRTLGEVVADAARKGDRQTLGQLSEAFDQLALWLLEQEFAHGDIKPENIMVAADGALRLVDYDGAYLPSMRGQAQREVGTETFQHPLRHQMQFGLSIDDYSIALISLSLRALARQPELYDRCARQQGELLVLPSDAVGGSSSMLDQIELSGLVGADLIACVRSKSPQIERLSEILSGATISVEHNALHPVKGQNGWGLADDCGEIIVSPIYDQVGRFDGRLAAVCLDGRWGFVDERGEIVVPIRYDRVWEFSDDQLALVLRDGKYGFVSRNGRVAVKPVFDYASSFSEGLAVAAIDQRYGYIDGRGRWVIEPKYDFARSFRGGVAEVELAGERLTINRP